MKILPAFTLLLCLSLTSCADLPGGPMDGAFASAVSRNNLQGVLANCTPQNASLAIRGVPPVVYAASHGNEDMIDVLYNNGASLNVRNPQGQSLAYLAAANGHRATAAKLAQLGSGSSLDISRGSSEYQQRRNREAAAARQLASRQAAAAKSSSQSSGGDRAASWFFRTLEWNSHSDPWYAAPTPRPSY